MTASRLARRIGLRVRGGLRLPLPSERVVRDSAGLLVIVDPADLIERVVYAKGCYEPQTCAVIAALLRPGDVFVDVGAHAGLHAVRAASVVGAAGAVVAIEPNPSSIARLQRNVELNGLENVVRVVPFAASDGAGSASLHLSDDPTNSGGASLHGQRIPTSTLEVARARLDDLVSPEEAPKVALMKIDVEGHESEVLLGAEHVLAVRPAIVFECNHRRPAELILEMGYRLYELPPESTPVAAMTSKEVHASTLDDYVRPGRGANLLALHPDSNVARRNSR